MFALLSMLIDPNTTRVFERAHNSTVHAGSFAMRFITKDFWIYLQIEGQCGEHALASANHHLESLIVQKKSFRLISSLFTDCSLDRQRKGVGVGKEVLSRAQRSLRSRARARRCFKVFAANTTRVFERAHNSTVRAGSFA